MSVDWYWTDLICPRNYERRKKVLHLGMKLITMLESDFRKTNELIRCFHEHLPGRAFGQVTLSRDLSVRDNCLALAERLGELLAYLNEKHGQLASAMEGDMFSELMSQMTSFADKIKVARKAPKNAIAATGGVPGMVVVSLGCQENCVPTMITALNAVSNCAYASISITAMSLRPDTIIKMVQETADSGNADENLTNFETNLEQLETASDNFTRTVDRMIIRIEG